jgi:hypothetical protein
VHYLTQRCALHVFNQLAAQLAARAHRERAPRRAGRRCRRFGRARTTGTARCARRSRATPSRPFSCSSAVRLFRCFPLCLNHHSLSRPCSCSAQCASAFSLGAFVVLQPLKSCAFPRLLCSSAVRLLCQMFQVMLCFLPLKSYTFPPFLFLARGAPPALNNCSYIAVLSLCSSVVRFHRIAPSVPCHTSFVPDSCSSTCHLHSQKLQSQSTLASILQHRSLVPCLCVQVHPLECVIFQLLLVCQ